MKTAIETIFDEALIAADAAALAVWERDGKTDRGTCGGAMLELKKGGVKGAKEFFALAKQKGIVGQHEGFISLHGRFAAAGIASQNADIPQDAYRAFRKVLEDYGLGGFVKRFWTYID